MLGHGEAGAEPELPVDPPWPPLAGYGRPPISMATHPAAGPQPHDQAACRPPGEPGAIHRAEGGPGNWISVGRDHQNPGHPGGSEHGAAWPLGVSDSVSAPTLGHPFTNLEQTQTTGALTVWGGRQRDPGRSWASGTPSRVSGKETAQDI